MPLVLHVLVEREHFDAALLAYPAVVLRVLESVGAETVVVAHKEDGDTVLVAQARHKFLRCEGLYIRKRQHQHFAVLG